MYFILVYWYLLLNFELFFSYIVQIDAEKISRYDETFATRQNRSCKLIKGKFFIQNLKGEHHFNPRKRASKIFLDCMCSGSSLNTKLTTLRFKLDPNRVFRPGHDLLIYELGKVEEQ